MKTINRKEYLEAIKKYKDLDLIKVITGVRRSGKSTILLQFIDYLKKIGIHDNQIVYYNFEKILDDKFYDYKYLHKTILEKIITGKKLYVFLDEIQEVKNFEKTIDSLYLNKEIDIYITGSNATLLSSELATLLTGRYIEIKVYPFSFKEYLEVKNEDIDKAFNNYITYGGMPYTLDINDNDTTIEYLNSLYSTILLKDIVKRKNIKDVNVLEDLSIYLCDSIGSIVSAKSIADALTSKGRKVSSLTIDNYITFLSESLLFYKCKRYDIKGKQNLESLNKLYIVDQGFRLFLVKSHSNYGRLLENIVFIELLRRGYKIKIGKINNLEVDFVCEKSGELKYIQVSASVLDENTFDRELKPLSIINDNFEKIIITMDNLPMSKDGIKVINIKDFLLSSNKNYL